MFEEVKHHVNQILQSSGIAANEETNINDTERFISVAAGTFIMYKGISQILSHPLIALQEAALGGYLMYRGASGHCPIYEKIGKDTTDLPAIRITETFIVSKPREEVYRFWRNLENLPRFMKHLHSVKEIDDKYSYWKANIPGELVRLDWNAQITREEENRYIGWQSVEGSMIDNAGKVEFKDAVSGAGTELQVEINYFPPAGAIGHGIAKLLNSVFENMVREDIKNFKHYIEGENYQQFAK